MQSVLYWACQHALCQHGVRRVRAPHCSCVLGLHVSLLTRERDSRARSLCKRRLRQSAWTQASPVSSGATRTAQPAAGLACTCGVVAADVLGSLRCGCRKDRGEQRLNTDTTLSNSNFVFSVFTRRIRFKSRTVVTYNNSIIYIVIVISVHMTMKYIIMMATRVSSLKR